ncbi:hypothetical protein TBLA_0A05020 [Henningerozyma blattae CBS 6284]|uniref:Uncharacterized protein n=1 Tax=Henningerozyma blattae (strain ATCC 34711 / CBS 6284 / DSM 70876 / NBRC 10599 / NRRL Y-10934 / UCD 77-7) TaxID=1071380 RepID=I2GVZ2_HENB6|nr:hypothetical protein TBLA_0A05020 [Tetrapisispora blattae CBS 6284]CCH58294.1 hypothetical protein TBLA_0A05020 [Tetrapisispora blattae CBS 6284]
MPIPADLSTLLTSKYNEAISNNHLKFTDSTIATVKDDKTKMPYYIRYAPNLASKPERDFETPMEDKVDPFANPEPELTVLDDVNQDGQYRLVLNKFPLVPEHALLVTKEFAKQTSTLTPSDLMTSFNLLKTLDDDDKRHMVFYNSGNASGSSQDHKHLQIIRLPQDYFGLQDKLTKDVDHYIPNQKTEPLQDDKVAFANFSLPLPDDESEITEDVLAMSYFSLLQRALTFFLDWTSENPNLDRSYNVLLTKKWISIVPRSNTKAKSMDVGFNSTGYAGLVLVRTEEIFETLKKDPSTIDNLLLECGFGNTTGVKADEYDY